MALTAVNRISTSKQPAEQTNYQGRRVSRCDRRRQFYITKKDTLLRDTHDLAGILVGLSVIPYSVLPFPTRRMCLLSFWQHVMSQTASRST